MKTITATTYTGNQVQVEKKAYRKAIKAFILKACRPRIPNPSNEDTIRYMRNKQASYNHAIDRAGLYCLRIINGHVTVI